MNVYALTKGFAHIAIVGPAPSVAELSHAAAVLGVSPQTVTPSLPLSELRELRDNAQTLLNHHIASTLTPPPNAAGEASSSSSSRRKQSSSKAQLQSANSPRYSTSLLMLGATSLIQGGLTLVAFDAFSQLAELLIEGLLIGWSAYANSTDAAQRLITGEKALRAAKATALLLGGLFGVVHTDAAFVTSLTKGLERDLRRRLMVKYFKETFFSRSQLLQAISFSPTDLYDYLQSSVYAWAHDLTQAGALTAKVVGQLGPTVFMSCKLLGWRSTLLSVAMATISYSLPLLVANAKRKDRIGDNKKQSRSNASSSNVSSTAKGSSQSASRASRQSTPPPSSLSPPPSPEVSGRVRSFGVLVRILSVLSAVCSVLIASSAALKPFTPNSSTMRGTIAHGFSAAREAIRALMQGRPNSNVTACFSSSVDRLRVSASARQYTIASLLLVNLCLSLTNLLRTVYGPLRSSGRHAADILRREAALRELSNRFLGEGAGAGGGDGRQREKQPMPTWLSYKDDSIVIQAVDVCGKPSSSTKSENSSANSGKGRERSSSASSSSSSPASSKALLLLPNLSFTVAPGTDLLLCCTNAVLRSSIAQMIGQLNPISPTQATGTPSRMVLPAADAVMYLGKSSFVQRLSLKQQLLYPKLSGSSHVGENTLNEVLERVGLTDLFDREDGELTPQGWETPCEQLYRRLSPAERQKICLARALYHQPRFLFIDGGMSALSPSEESHFYGLFHQMCITTITAVDLDVKNLIHYAPHHKALLQIESDATNASSHTYIFGTFMSKAAPHLPSSSSTTSSTPVAKSATPMRRGSGNSRLSFDSSSLPSLRIIHASDPSAVGKIIPFDNYSGVYAHGDAANPFR